MINFNANITGPLNSMNGAFGPNGAQNGTATGPVGTPKIGGADGNKGDFANTVKGIKDYVSKVDELQQSSDMSITDLLSGKNEDITSVVSAVAKADVSFKLLLGVRNKLIEAYKQTMNMPL